MNDIEVIAVGSQVVVDGNIPAVVRAVEIRDSLVTYQCSWWDERKRQTDWLSSDEIKPRGSEAHRTARIKIR